MSKIKKTIITVGSISLVIIAVCFAVTLVIAATFVALGILHVG